MQGLRLSQAKVHAFGVAFAALALLAAVAIYVHLGRGTVFFYDEWNFILDRTGWSADSLLSPHNGHLSLIPILIYKIYLSVFGLTGYLPYRLTILALHLICVVLLYVFVSRRVSQSVGLAAAFLLLFLGTGWENTLWPFQIGFVGSIASGLGMLLALDRRDRKGDVAATVLLAVSVACSGVGGAFLIGAAVHVLAGRDRVSRLWIFGLPLAGYLAWSVAYGESQITRENLIHTPAYVANAIAGAFGGLSGLGIDWGRPLTVAAALILLILIVRSNRIPLWGAVVLAIAFSFWVLTGASRSTLGEPDSPRYVYAGVVFIALIAAQFASGIRIAPLGLACLWAVVFFAVAANLSILRSGAAGLRDTSQYVKAELLSVEKARDTVAQDFQPDPQRVPQVRAGPYLTAVAKWGSPAYTEAQLERRADPVRQAATAVLAKAEASATAPSAPAQTP